MSFDKAKQQEVGGTAIASLVLALISMGLAFLNSRPTTEGAFLLTLLVSFLSLALVALSLMDILLGRAGLYSLWLALPAAGVAVLAIYTALGCRAVQEGGFRRMVSANNLKRQALALLDYEKANGRLPPSAVSDKAGRPLLSWRVLVLPYLEQEGLAERGLFQQFNLDEPWDSPHNLRLLEKMPEVYAPPKGVSTPRPYTTYYQVFYGRGAAFEGTDGVQLADFRDGPGNTFLVLEAGEAVPWTKPEDLAYAPEMPLPKLGGMFRSGFHAALADGSIRFIGKETSAETLRAAITRNGGDTLGSDW